MRREETGMARTPELVAEFLEGRRVAVAGVSRGSQSAANPVYRKLRDAGYEVFPVNPKASQVEGVTCYPDLASIPGDLDGVVVATHPNVSVEVVRQAADRKVPRVWLHRSFGQGSVSPDAVRECEKAGLSCIVGGCPLMYREPVDFGHRCMRGLLGWLGRLPR
jgi:predicted CoA-binding protein